MSIKHESCSQWVEWAQWKTTPNQYHLIDFPWPANTDNSRENEWKQLTYSGIGQCSGWVKLELFSNQINRVGDTFQNSSTINTVFIVHCICRQFNLWWLTKIAHTSKALFSLYLTDATLHTLTSSSMKLTDLSLNWSGHPFEEASFTTAARVHRGQGCQKMKGMTHLKTARDWKHPAAFHTYLFCNLHY